MLLGNADRTLTLRDLHSGRCDAKLSPGTPDGLSRVAITSDGRTALSGSSDETLEALGSIYQRRGVCPPSQATPTPVKSVAIAPDGRTALRDFRRDAEGLSDKLSGRELRTYGDARSANSFADATDRRTAGTELAVTCTPGRTKVAVSADCRTAVLRGFYLKS